MAHESKVLHNFLMPVLALCTDIQHDSNVYVVEDGLALWLACIENATDMTDDLMQLYQNMPPLLGTSAQSFRYISENIAAWLFNHLDNFIYSCFV